MLETEKKLWHIAFSFDEPRPGVITIPADNEEDAKKLLLDMAKNMHNVEIYDIVDASLLPNIQDMMRVHSEMETEAVDDVKINPEKTNKEKLN